MDIDALCKDICFGDYSNEDLVKLHNAIRYRRSQLTYQVRDKLRVGDEVKFTNTRTGNIVKGKVNKVNRKFVIVDAGPVRWRVPAGMLESV